MTSGLLGLFCLFCPAVLISLHIIAQYVETCSIAVFLFTGPLFDCGPASPQWYSRQRPHQRHRGEGITSLFVPDAVSRTRRSANRKKQTVFGNPARFVPQSACSTQNVACRTSCSQASILTVTARSVFRFVRNCLVARAAEPEHRRSSVENLRPEPELWPFEK